MKTKVLVPFIFISTISLGQTHQNEKACEVKPPLSREYYCGEQFHDQQLGVWGLVPSKTWMWKPNNLLTRQNNTSLSTTKNNNIDSRKANGFFDWLRKNKCVGKDC